MLGLAWEGRGEIWATALGSGPRGEVQGGITAEAAGDQSAPYPPPIKEEEKVGVYPVDFPSAWKRRGGGEPARTGASLPRPLQAAPPPRLRARAARAV